KNAFAQVGYTFPSMMSILTSVYPASHKVYFAFKDKLPKGVKTLPELLKIIDYKTAWFAVLEEPHLALDAGYGRGFDSVNDVDLKLNGRDKIPQWINENKEQPFFIAMNFRHTHGPYFPKNKYKGVFKSGKKGKLIENVQELESKVFEIIASTVEKEGSLASQMFAKETVRNNRESFTGRYSIKKFVQLEELIRPEQRHKMGHLMMKTYNDSVNKFNKENMEYFVSLYDACILGTDQEVIQPVIKALKKEGLYDKTLIIVMGDHGESHGEHGIIGHGIPFYDELIHVPLVIKMPNGTLRNEKDEIVQSIDILPTVLDVIGMEKPYNIHGQSLLPLMEGKQNDLKNFKFAFGQNNDLAYIRSQDWKLVVNLKHIEEPTGDYDELFNIKEDPSELKNIKFEKFGKYEELRAILKEHLASLPDYTDINYQFAPNIDPATQERIKKTGYW
ncbi:MAG: sulfatase-like hydrolase/transferase, partial [Bacteroidetes bacterium]|nr:sulfatase-like hydrolase/transferase [Bacteroidota bacterium]